MCSLGFSITTLFIAMVSIQSGAALAKQMFPIVGSVGTTMLRLSLASLILGVVWRPWKVALKRREVYAVIFYGVALGFMNLLFYLSLQRIPLGIAVALEFTGPLTLSFIASRQWFDYLWATLAAIGIILILPVIQTSGSLDPVGVCLALGAGCFWALYIVFGQKVGNLLHGGRATALGMIVAFLVILPVGLMNHPMKLLSLEVLPLAFVMAILSSVLPYSLEMIALKHLPIKTLGILMSLEPVMGAIAGLLFLGEELTVVQWIAIGCIITASAGSSLARQPEVNPILEASV